MDEVARRPRDWAADGHGGTPLASRLARLLSRVNAQAGTPLAVIALMAIAVLIGAPLVGWPRVVRLPAVLVPAMALALLMLRPWRWDQAAWDAVGTWTPTPRAIRAGAVALAALLFWIVLTRFQSGEINAVDFTVYFDRPCFQTLQGRPLFVETADFSTFSYRSGLGHHAFWGMLPLCGLYALSATPLWLLTASVVAVAAGAMYVVRVLQYVGAGGVLAVAGGLAFALNDNTARTLNYGFHPEVFYAWFIPWMLDAGLRGHRRSFVAATFACLLVKEDAFLVLLAVSSAIGLHRFRDMTPVDRVVFLIAPFALGLANLGIYYAFVIPAVTGNDRLIYSDFWAHYGPTPAAALLGMMTHPQRLLADLAGSAFFRRVIGPNLFLPLAGWRWILGVAPIVILYSSATDPQLRLFGIYYAIPLVPFLAIGTAAGGLFVMRHLIADARWTPLAAAVLVLAGAVLVGIGDRGYTLRPWRPEIAAVPEALARLADERVVLVQSGLYPHAGYDERVQLLTPETLHSSRHAGAVLLLAPGIGAYPFAPHDVNSLSQLPPVGPVPGGLRAVRRAAE